MKRCRPIFIILIFLCVIAAGCSKDGTQTGKKNQDNGKVNIVIGNWPDSSNVSRRQTYDNLLQKMRKMHPDMDISTDEYSYDVTTFSAKAESKQLPTLFNLWFTEIKKVVDAGYLADLTDVMYERGYAQAMNPDLLKLVSDDAGKIYAVPIDAYAQGIIINKKIFEEAGVTPPQSWQELGEAAKAIKEKTGKPGFAIAGKNNNGGWQFLNIAWSYGVTFVDKIDGKWTAMFDTPECVEALQYIKDLKWKYDALPESIFIDADDIEELFSSGNLGMFINAPSSSMLNAQIGKMKENIKLISMPKGPKGRYTQMGGNVQAIPAGASREEIEAVFDWIEICGASPKVNDEALAGMEEIFKECNQNGGIVLNRDPFQVWINREREEKIAEIREKYTNIDPRNYEEYCEFEGVIINSEPSVAAQELYHILDGCIQEVVSDSSANCADLISKAAKDYQQNYLDTYKD